MTEQTVNEQSSGIKLKGHKGTWYTIDHSYILGEKVFLMESEVWGDETSHKVVDKNGNILHDEEWNWFSDYREKLGI